MKILVTAAALLALAVLTGTAAYARNPCDAEYDTLHDNYCLHNPSKCVDSRVDWKSVAARCGIPEETPYQQGVRNYREGLCYRARPYTDHGPEQKLWERGYDAAQKQRDAKYRHRRYVEWPPNCHIKSW